MDLLGLINRGSTLIGMICQATKTGREHVPWTPRVSKKTNLGPQNLTLIVSPSIGGRPLGEAIDSAKIRSISAGSDFLK